MDPEFWNALNEYDELGRELPLCDIPLQVYSTALARNRLSLIGRPLNTTEQNLHDLIEDLPHYRNLSSRVHGRIFNPHFVQFSFHSDQELVSVLRRQPCLYNGWFVVLQRWEVYPPHDYLNTIDLWVQIRGLPLQFISNQTAYIIGETLGEVLAVEFVGPSITHSAFVRVKLRYNIRNRVRFYIWVRFHSGDIILAKFHYENLSRMYFYCQRLTHDSAYCPFVYLYDENMIPMALSVDDNQATESLISYSYQRSLSPRIPDINHSEGQATPPPSAANSPPNPWDFNRVTRFVHNPPYNEDQTMHGLYDDSVNDAMTHHNGAEVNDEHGDGASSWMRESTKVKNQGDKGVESNHKRSHSI